MKKLEIEKVIQMNERLLLVLGYAMGFIFTNDADSKDPRYIWLITAIENLVYLDKPLPKMP